MDQQRPRTSSPAGGSYSRTDLGRPSRRIPLYRRLCLAMLIVLALALGGLWRPHPAPGADAVPTVTLNPTSGLPGSTVSIAALYFPYSSDSPPSTITFDVGGQQVAVGQQLIVLCTSIAGARIYGFGLPCTGTDVTFRVPALAAPGQHTVTVTVIGANIPSGQFSQTAPFTVGTPPTETQTATSTPTATSTMVPPTATGTPTSTMVPPTATGTAAVPTGTATGTAAVPTGTATGTSAVPPSATPVGISAYTATPTVVAIVTATPLGLSTYIVYTATPTASPSTSPSRVATAATATATQTPPHATPTSTPTPSATPTALPKPGGALILAKPAFVSGTLLVSTRADPGSSIHIAFTVGHLDQGKVSTDYSLAEGGTADARGRFAKLLRIAYHHSGQATLTVSIQTGKLVRAATRHYRFSPG